MKDENIGHCDKEWDEQNVLKLLCDVSLVLNHEQKRYCLHKQFPSRCCQSLD